MNRRAFLLGSTALVAASSMPVAAVEAVSSTVAADGIPSLGTLSRAQLEADWQRILVEQIERVINPPWLIREDGVVEPVPSRWLVGY